MVLLFGVASFLSAGLLFVVQPMVGKMVLPLFGGSPAVWNTAMLFFQVVLLAGYAYAHVSTRWLGLARQPLVHVVALLGPLLLLPIGLPSWVGVPEGVMPALWLLYVLVLVVGAPFLLVSTSGPLLQRWFSATDHRRAADPYFLYAAGNAGSLLALVAYPLVIEPTLSLEAQRGLWSLGYGVFVLLALGCVVAVYRRRAPERGGGSAQAYLAGRGAPIRLARQLAWVGLAFVPSSLMLGVTSFASTDIAAFPLLWVVPLAIYLATFIIAFGQRRPSMWLGAARLLPALVLAVALSMAAVAELPAALQIALHLLFFAAVALVAHGRLAADRPEAARLTHFYLLLAVGGALGGVFNGLLAPVIFNHVIEYPLVIAASVFLLIGLRHREHPPRPTPLPQRAFTGAVVVGVPWFLQQVADRMGSGATVVLVGVLLGALGAVAMVAARRPVAFAIGMSLVVATTIPFTGDALRTERTFFGVARVEAERVEAEGDRHVLVHGTTVHGWQDRRPDRLTVPQSYYERSGPIGDVFAVYGPQPLADEVALIGLGTGGLAAYGRGGQRLVFYEIDQAIVDIATDPGLFSFVTDTAAETDIVVGDGRLTLAEAPDNRYGMIIIDAFSSDAIPVHLMTSEAFELYRSKLAPGGVIVFHISNRHMNLEPVLAGIAQRQDLTATVRDDHSDTALGKSASTWAVVAEASQTLAPLTSKPGWQPLAVQPGDELVWTDDFSDIVRVLNW